MSQKQKPVADMSPEEYIDYVKAMDDSIFMQIISHDVKKVVAVAHGYISLIRLDVEEDALNSEQLMEYLQEMEQMLEKSYSYLAAAETIYQERHGKNA
jgi:hypothetical protein